jgi:hypothetical protein
VHSITAAAAPHSDDLDARIRRYLISMGIRTVCVILVIVIDGPVRWVFAVLAIVLPYIAVVMANVVGRRQPTVVPAVTPPVVTHISLPRAEPVPTWPASQAEAAGESAERPTDGSSERTA